MKEKYIEERYPRYFIFGVQPATGMVDVNNGNGDVAVGVTRAKADEMIEDRNKMVDAIVAFYMKYPALFFSNQK